MTPEQRAAEEYAGVWAEHIRTGRFLRILAGVLAAAALTLAVAAWNLSSRTVKPLVVRVDEVGRAQAVEYEAMELNASPQDATTLFFIRQFLSDHFSRRTQVVAERWPRSLLFLSEELSQRARSRDMAEVTRWSAGQAEGEIDVQGVVLQVTPRSEPPWEVTARYDLAEYRDGEKVRRTPQTTSMRYVLLDRAPPELYRTNPIGLVITYLETAAPQ